MGPAEVAEGSAYIFYDAAYEGSLRVAIALKSLHMKLFKELFFKELVRAEQSCTQSRAESA